MTWLNLLRLTALKLGLLGQQDSRCIVSVLKHIQAHQSGKRVYLSGPMNGLPEFNYPAFNDKASELRARGWHVENPAENPAPPCGAWNMYMRMALWQLLSCEAIYLLPGWENSRGACVEYSIAQTLGMEVIEVMQQRAWAPASEGAA